jgi:hypothetical protein
MLKGEPYVDAGRAYLQAYELVASASGVTQAALDEGVGLILDCHRLSSIEIRYTRIRAGRGVMSTAVRKTPSWPRSWANSSRFSLYSHRNAWANLHILGQPNTLLARGRLAQAAPTNVTLSFPAGHELDPYGTSKSAFGMVAI